MLDSEPGLDNPGVKRSHPETGPDVKIMGVRRRLRIDAAVLCDRGTVDGSAYWPGPEDFWASLSTTLDEQLRRFGAAVHLRTPVLAHGYNHENPLRVESATEAAAIAERIARVRKRHPRRLMVEATPDFVAKASRALGTLREEMPECCRRHTVALRSPPA